MLACKIIKKANLTNNQLQDLEREINILSSTSSPYVVGLRTVEETKNNYYLFMEFCNGGDLADLKRLRGRFTEQEVRYLLREIIKGFKALQEMGVLHRDLKPANILVHFENLSQDIVLAGGQ